MITAAIRTPITKSRVGLFKDTPSEELIVHVLKAIREQSNIDPGVVEEICVGNTLTPAPAYGARSAALSAGFPNTTAVHVVSRFCSTGLLSVQTTATAIATGVIDVGIAVGVESMSRNSDKPPSVSAKVLTTQEAKDVLQPMVWTAEQVSRRFNVSREEQDKFAVYSQHQAEKAFKEGWTQDEIAPVTTQWVDAKTGGKKIITVSKDETPRHGTTYEALAKIKSATPQWGNTTTGGNASKLADGAAALLLMKRSTAERLGQKILGKYVQSTSVGVEPAIMGISPIYAIPKVLKKTGLTKEDVDIFEINEAFASMVSSSTVFYATTSLTESHEVRSLREGSGPGARESKCERWCYVS